MRIFNFLRKIFLKNNKIEVSVSLPYWERKACELKGKSILNSKHLKKNKETIYLVFDVRKVLEQKFRKVKKTNLRFDVTWLKSGILKTRKYLQPYQTFGHLHEKYRGEFYYVLKGHVIFLLSNVYNGNTIIKEIGEDEWIFIHPIFIHKAISKNDSLFLGIVPKDAGHNYKIVEKNGLPFYPVIKNSKIEFIKNKWKSKYQPRLEKVETIFRTKLPELEKIEKILRYPDEHSAYY